MEHIAELQLSCFLARYGLGAHEACVDWAIERLRRDEEGDDNDVVLLAGSTTREEAMPLTEKVVARYVGLDAADEQRLAGKYVVRLRDAYRAGDETIASLDERFSKLYVGLGYPNWLTMLARNCEYATDVSAFEEPFEQELDYVAGLWASASSLAEFEQAYDRSVSNRHDVKPGND